MDEVNAVEPHEMSTVLSGALYELLTRTFEERRRRLVELEGNRFEEPEFSLSGKALYTAVQQFARMIYRALDYLPRGEISFADYGRAILAADRVAFPDEEADVFRNFLGEAFVSRKIVPDKGDLDTRIDFLFPLSQPVDLDDLVESDWAAYDFANRPEVRGLLGIPDQVRAFRVHPRLRTSKQLRSAPTPVQDVVFKVSWDHEEENNVGNGLPPTRRVTAGATLVISMDLSRNADSHQDDARVEAAQTPMEKRSRMPPYQSGRVRLQIRGAEKYALHVRARLVSDVEQQHERDLMLVHLLKEGLVEMDYGEDDANGPPREAAVRARIRSNSLQMTGTARLLHIATPNE